MSEEAKEKNAKPAHRKKKGKKVTPYFDTLLYWFVGFFSCFVFPVILFSGQFASGCGVALVNMLRMRMTVELRWFLFMLDADGCVLC